MEEKHSSSPETKLKIRKEAQRLFSEKGFSGTGIDAIAKKCGIVKSVIYYHYKNKKDILDTIIDSFIHESLLFKEKNKAEIYQGEFDKVIDAMLDFLLDRKEVIQIIFMESIKQSGQTPLFHLIDVFFSSITEINTNCSKETLENMKIEEFYMFYIPLVNFIILSDGWSETYNVDRKKVKAKFADIVVKYINNIYKPALCR